MEAILQFGERFGAMGILVGYLIWRETSIFKYNQARLEADIKMATALTALSVAIHNGDRGDGSNRG